MDGLYCVAAPLLDMSNKAIAAISLSGQKILLEGRSKEIVSDLITLTKQLSIC
jgi:DNA-binding IclR family transcriptional regulator